MCIVRGFSFFACGVIQSHPLEQPTHLSKNSNLHTEVFTPMSTKRKQEMQRRQSASGSKFSLLLTLKTAKNIRLHMQKPFSED